MGIVYAHRPIVTPVGTTACFVIQAGGYEVSVSCDDSCGQMEKLARSDIRVYKNDVDMTVKFFPGSKEGDTVHASAERLYQALSKAMLGA